MESTSPSDLACGSPRDRRTIHRWEYAQRVPNLEDLLLLADVLGVPLANLVR
ncbi:helix-turn-helix transcriptional regulator [Streptomyces griseoviridis]|nr:helix-turn-helix transcriptional regulator [Streptomyces niveoruber]